MSKFINFKNPFVIEVISRLILSSSMILVAIQSIFTDVLGCRIGFGWMQDWPFIDEWETRVT